MIQEGHPGYEGAHFGSREDDRQLEDRRGAGELQFGGPNPLEGFLPEELDGAQGLGGALAGKLALVLEVDEILAELLGAELVGRAVKVLGELAHTGPVALLRAVLERQQGQIIGKALQDCVGGTFFICMATI